MCRAALASGATDPISFTTLRFGSGAVVLGLVAWRRGGGVRLAFAGRSAVVLVAYAIPFSVAYARLPTGVGALLLFTAVQLTMIGSAMRARAHPTREEWIGLALSLFGLVVLTRPGLARPDLAGAALMLGAGVAWGLYSLRGRVSGDPVATNALAFVLAAPMCVAASALTLLGGSARLDLPGVVLAVASGAIASGGGYVLWYSVLPLLTATRAALLQLAVPPLAAIGGIAFLHETWTTRLVLASALILGGIAVAIGGRARRRF